MVEAYLHLEGLRLANRLRVTLECDPCTLGMQIPPLSLQTLVENAVKFGSACRSAGGDVFYSLHIESQHLVLLVTNTGQLGAPSHSTGIGLKNLRSRLTLLYGDKAFFRLFQMEPEKVAAEARIPLDSLTHENTHR